MIINHKSKHLLIKFLKKTSVGRWLIALAKISNTRWRVDQLENRPKNAEIPEHFYIMDVLEDLISTHKKLVSDSISIDEKINKISEIFKEKECNPFMRNFISGLLKEFVEKKIHRRYKAINRGDYSTLEHDGIIALNDLRLSEVQVNDIRKYFEDKLLYNAHVYAYSDKIGYSIKDIKKISSIGSYHLKDSVNCPHLLKIATDPNILGIVEEYLGCVPTIYSFNTWWYFPGHPQTGPQDFHRDIDDYKFLALFIYLTDIYGDEQGGQHQYIRKTHNEDSIMPLLSNDKELASAFFHPKIKNNGYHYSNLYSRFFKDQISDIIGQAGSIFLADSYGFHRGVPPKKEDRLVCWIRYGYGENITYKNDKNYPVESKISDSNQLNDPYFKYMTRLIAK